MFKNNDNINFNVSRKDRDISKTRFPISMVIKAIFRIMNLSSGRRETLPVRLDPNDRYS